MFNFIKKKFQNKKSENICTISFHLKNDGTTTTELYWPEFDKLNNNNIENIAIEYATLLFLVSNGDYKQDILDTLLIAKSNNKTPKDQLFINMIQIQLSLLDSVKRIDPNVPVVSPISVFKR